MLGDKDVMATVAVKNATTSKKFYEETLELELLESDQPGVFSFKCGDSSVLVYESQYAGTNKATAATFNVGSDIEEIVSDLVEKGVKFEHYKMPGLKLEGDIHVGGDMKVAWFKDPDGNIIAVAGT